jgi:tartrate dehydratase alpha subunit/fumarate hydratase class I-like protein
VPFLCHLQIQTVAQAVAAVAAAAAAHHEAQPHAALHKHVAAEEGPKARISAEELLKNVLCCEWCTASTAAKPKTPKPSKP